MEKKLLLKITLKQLHQLYDLQFLSGKGMDFYIERLLEDKTEPLKVRVR